MITTFNRPPIESHNAARDELLGAIIGLVRAYDGLEPSEHTDRTIIEGLFHVIPNEGIDPISMQDMIVLVHAEKKRLAPDCFSCTSPCGRTADYDMNLIWQSPLEIRSLKNRLIVSICSIAAFVYLATVPVDMIEEIRSTMLEAIYMLGYDALPDELHPVLSRVEELDDRCMTLLSQTKR